MSYSKKVRTVQYKNKGKPEKFKKVYDNKLVKIKSFYKEKNIQTLYNDLEPKFTNKQISEKLRVSLRSLYRYKSYLRNDPEYNKGQIIPDTKKQKKIFQGLKKLAKENKIPVSKELSFNDTDIIERRLKSQLTGENFLPYGGLLHFLTEFIDKTGNKIEKWFTVRLAEIGSIPDFIENAVSELNDFFSSKISSKYGNTFYKIKKITFSFRNEKQKNEIQ